jgi:hypothetical protein
MDEQDKTRAALAGLTDVLVDIARTADEKNRERCPYKTVDLRCTYAGGCQNQRRETATVLCAGDSFIAWKPAGTMR